MQLEVGAPSESHETNEFHQHELRFMSIMLYDILDILKVALYAFRDTLINFLIQ